MSGATLAFLGLSGDDRLRAMAGAQIRLHGGDGMRGGGKNVVLCGRGPTIGGGELLVEHIHWQVAHLHLRDGGPLFDRTLDDLLAIDIAALPASPAARAYRREATDADWPVCQEIELVSAAGASIRLQVADVRVDQPLAAAVRALMSGVDAALAGAAPFRTVGPAFREHITDCFAEAIRRELVASLQGRRDDWFIAALRHASDGDLSARERLQQPWPPTNSGIEVAQGNAALFLLGAPLRRDMFVWHRHPGQPGSRLRRLVALASARPW